MTKLTEGMVIGRTRATDLKSVRKLNCWGSELSDVSLVRQMPNVEVLSLSVNSITTLADFGHCPNLTELYVRKNMISDLSEIIYLKDLPKLRNLWLEDNPCAVGDRYRLTVLRYLPNLKKLDNILVQPDEVSDAMRYGTEMEHPSEKRQLKESVISPTSDTPAPSSPSSPPHPAPNDRDNTVDSEGNVYIGNGSAGVSIASDNSHHHKKGDILPHSERRLVSHSQFQDGEIRNANILVDASPSEDVVPSGRFTRRSRSEVGVTTSAAEKDTVTSHSMDMEQMTYERKLSQTQSHPVHGVQPQSTPREYYDAGHVQQFHPHSFPPQHVAHSDAYVDDDHDVYRYSAPSSAAQHHPPQPTSHPMYQKLIQHQFLDKILDSPNKPYPVRPKNRNSNILSAVLCLIKELDCAGLEVVEMAVRCRMEELDE